MANKKKKDKKDFINMLGSICSILSLVILIITFFVVDRIRELVDTSKNWIIKLELNQPLNNSNISGKVERIKGKFEFYTTAAEAHDKGPVNLIMYQKSIVLLCFVRPISIHNSNQNKYYLQTKPIVHQNGEFESLVFFGNVSEENDLATSYQIIVLAVPKKSIPKGFVFDNLPFYLAASNSIVVKRGGQALKR
jgi:hypothetical protein